MTIERRKREATPTVPAEPAGPSQLVEFRDIDFNFGSDDIAGFTLGPTDTFVDDETDSFFYIQVNNEVVYIDRSRVRWWSTRTRKVAIPVASFDPGATNDL